MPTISKLSGHCNPHCRTAAHSCLGRGVAELVVDVLALHGVARKDERNNETIQTESLSENEDNTDEELWLASVGADTGVTDDADSNTGREAGHTTAKASRESRVPRVRSIGVWGITSDGGGEKYSDDKPVDTEHTSHNDWNNGLHDHLGVENTHVCHTDTGLRGSVRSAEACEDERSSAAHEAEEWRGGGAHLLTDGDEGNTLRVGTAIRSEDGSIGGDASGSEEQRLRHGGNAGCQ